MNKVYLIFISLFIAITAQSVLASKTGENEKAKYEDLSGYHGLSFKQEEK